MVRATNVDTRGRQDVGTSVCVVVGALQALWPQAHHREVGGAAPCVNHQHGAFLCQALLVVQRCGNWFKLKRDFFKADRQHRLKQ